MALLRIYSYSLYWFLILFFPFYNTYALTLQIGTLSYNPPFEIQLTNTGKEEFYGFEINLMEEVCKRIKAKCQYKSLLFKDIMTEINSGEISLGIATIAITPERSQNFLFSLPYKSSSQQFIALANSNFTKIQGLKGQTIGVYVGSPIDAFVKKLFKNDIKIKYYTIASNMLSALDKNEINAVISNSEQANYWINNMSNYKLLGTSFPNTSTYAIMAKLGQDELIEQINQALIDMENDGTYLKIYNLSF